MSLARPTVVAAAVVVLAGCGGSSKVEPEAMIATAARPVGIAASDDALWLTAEGGGVQRIDPQENRVVATVEQPFSPEVVADREGVWTADGSVVRRIDVRTNRVVASIPNMYGEGLELADGSLWFTEHNEGAVARIDPSTNRVVATIRLGPDGSSGPKGIAAGAGDVWVGVPNLGQVARVDPTTNRVKARVRVDQGAASPCGEPAVDVAGGWIGSCADVESISQFDPATNRLVRTIQPGGYADCGGGVFADGAVWCLVAPAQESGAARAKLIRLEPDQAKPTKEIPLPDGTEPSSMVHAFGSLWVVDGALNRLLRYSDSVLD